MPIALPLRRPALRKRDSFADRTILFKGQGCDEGLKKAEHILYRWIFYISPILPVPDK